MDGLNELVTDTVHFFASLGFLTPQMRIRASFNDPILIEAVDNAGLSSILELDNRSNKYDHFYGDNLTGRVIKLDYYQDWADKHKNLCYFIVICDHGQPIGAEMATSDQLILMRTQGFKYAISASKISELLPLNSFAERRFADSIVGLSHMLYEGIKPNSSNTNGRTLKKYMSAALNFGKELGVDLYYL